MPKNTQPLVVFGLVLVLAGLSCLTPSEFLARSVLASEMRFVKKVSNNLTWMFASRHQSRLRVSKTVSATQFLRHPPPSEEVRRGHRSPAIAMSPRSLAGGRRRKSSPDSLPTEHLFAGVTDGTRCDRGHRVVTTDTR